MHSIRDPAPLSAPAASGQLGYDELVLLMAQATALTNRFRAHDPRGAGFATLSYAQFLDVVFSSL
jgi:hypothetical protein